MIREKSLLCKILLLKITGKELFESYMAGFKAHLEICPLCHAKGRCHIFGHYIRNLISYCLGAVKYEQVVITRVKCASCKHTHAILPDLIIPYGAYSLLFIMRVLSDYLSHSSTVETLCKKYNISHTMLYRWLDMYYKHKELWLGVLKSMETDGHTFLSDILTIPNFSDFTSGFFALASFSFLQSHANPAHTYRRPQNMRR